MDREPKREPEWRKGWDGPHIALVVLAVVALALAGGLAWVEYGRHAEAMQALAESHKAEMQALADRRQDTAARHEATMQALADRRQDAAAQHEATMTALQALIRNTAAPGSQTLNYGGSR